MYRLLCCSPPMNRFEIVMYPPFSRECKTFLQVDTHIEQFFAIIGTDQKLCPAESFARTRKEKTINSFGDNRSSKILFGKRKYCPLQFLRIRNPPSKLFERVFCRVKTKIKTQFKKLPLLYGEKFPFCSGVFQNSLHLVYI